MNETHFNLASKNNIPIQTYVNMEVAQNPPQNVHDDADEYFNKPDILDIASPHTNFHNGWRTSPKEIKKTTLIALADHNYCDLSECNLILEGMISEYLKNKSVKLHCFAPAEGDIQEYSKNILSDIDNIQFVADVKMYDDNMDFEDQVQNIINAVSLKETTEANLQELSNETDIEQIVDVETKPLNQEKFNLSTDQLQVLQKLGDFAENLLRKSQTLLNNETEMNEQEFDKFLSTALLEMKQLTITSAEQAVQTELSKKALRRLNAEQKIQNKRYSSSSCSSTDSETDGNSSSSSSSSSSSNSSASIKVEEKKILKKEKSSNKSDLGGDEAESDSIDENDKEIERLINFDGLLMKKQKYNGGSQLPTKSTDILKLKTKLKAIDLLLAGSCSDETDSSSDSVDGQAEKAQHDFPEDVTMTNVNNGQDLKKSAENEESDKEVITEKEFLKRYNDTLKNHFLNDSSSMSEDSVASDVEILQNLKADEENCDKLVDKFLETYSPEQEEEDAEEEKKVQAYNEEIEKKTHVENDNNSLEEQPHVDNQEKRKALKSSLSEFIKLPKSPARISEKREHSDDIEKAESESKNNDVDGALSSSDCELLNESNLQPKPAKAAKKSFETMLSEAEKRNKKQKLDTSDLISLSSDSSTSNASDAETVDGEQSKSGQQSRAIKPMLRQDQLASETRRAQKSEADRIRRLEKKQNMMSKVLKERNKKCEGKAEAQNELILDYNSETKTFIKVHPDIVKQLKSHQFDGIKFMYDSCYGGVDALKKSQGSGCILAHCMGLGKTLQVHTYIHK